ncbi:hypothetical protein AC1031_016879 [Aphanomyces cochlioides]|nr:hypothetical protein AC1031_016879 [Aphanomyces cochlioides]
MALENHLGQNNRLSPSPKVEWPKPAYRGKCKYKGGRCPNERTLRYTGEVHTLCEEHRLRQNKIQSKSDTKMRRFKRLLAMRNKGSEEDHATTPIKTELSPPHIDDVIPLVPTPVVPQGEIVNALCPEEMHIFIEMMGVE